MQVCWNHFLVLGASLLEESLTVAGFAVAGIPGGHSQVQGRQTRPIHLPGHGEPFIACVLERL